MLMLCKRPLNVILELQSRNVTTGITNGKEKHQYIMELA
jgi:hypothetical protein